MKNIAPFSLKLKAFPSRLQKPQFEDSLGSVPRLLATACFTSLSSAETGRESVDIVARNAIAQTTPVHPNARFKRKISNFLGCFCAIAIAEGRKYRIVSKTRMRRITK